MNNSFIFFYTIPGTHGKPGTDLLCEAHREGEDIELDHVWLGNTDILPVLEWGHATFLLCEIEVAALEYKDERHRDSLMG